MSTKSKTRLLVKKPLVVACPTCHGTITGTIGKDRYFCADCCTEFVLGQKTVVYEITDVGNVFRKINSPCQQLSLFA